MAVTGPFNDSQTSTSIEAPGYLVTKSLANGESLTIDFENVSQMFQVYSDTGAVKVSRHADGVANDAYGMVPAGAYVPFVEQTKKVVVTNNSGGVTVVSVHATLSDIPASDWPAMSDATGFDGVNSLKSAAVA